MVGAVFQYAREVRGVYICRDEKERRGYGGQRGGVQSDKEREGGGGRGRDGVCERYAVGSV